MKGRLEIKNIWITFVLQLLRRHRFFCRVVGLLRWVNSILLFWILKLKTMGKWLLSILQQLNILELMTICWLWLSWMELSWRDRSFFFFFWIINATSQTNFISYVLSLRTGLSLTSEDKIFRMSSMYFRTSFSSSLLIRFNSKKT